MSSKKVITEHQKVIIDESTQSLSSDGSIIIRNPNLKGLKSDVLYHLAMSTDTHDFPALFGDVKFVCMGGSLARMKSFAQYMAQQLDIEFKDDDLTQASRYSMFKIGPVISVTHGMGISSLSILMHELIKLVYYSKCKNVVFLRIGTSGGIGVEPGTVVVSDKAVDGLLRPYYELHILGEVVRRPALFDKELVEELKSISVKEMIGFPTVSGTTMCCLDFYEAQGRLDGAFCDITNEEKMQFMIRMKNEGVVNIEMESVAFASMCHFSGIRGAVICVTLLNRLKEDQICSSKKTLEEFQTRPMILAAKFIKNRLLQYNQQY